MTSDQYRIEGDSMGRVKVPAGVLYSAQTQRALENFPPSGMLLPAHFIKAIALIKKAAAEVNEEMGLLDGDVAQAIVSAANEVIDGQHLDQFPVDVFQTGSGTSTNMNVNEVLATLASRHCAGVNPNDHVNRGQSSNDVIPTAIHLAAAIAIVEELLPALNHLAEVIDKKAEQVAHVCKVGRTHLMDAVPIRMSQEMGAWSTQVRNGMARIKDSMVRLRRIAQGGTAVGTGINAAEGFAEKMAQKLSCYTHLQLAPNSSLFESLSSQDTAVELSGQLKVVAVSFMKIANDLRWMNSGPGGGLAEIALPSLQPGSSIMPAKVNPVIPEAAAMVAAQVIGNDATITIAGQSGNFQLNVMLPVIAFNLLQSITLLSMISKQLADKAISGFTVNEENLENRLGENPILVTTLTPRVGHKKAAKIAQRAVKEKRPLIEVAQEETGFTRSELEQFLDPVKATEGGIR